MGRLYQYIIKQQNLYRAYQHVRKSAERSSNDRIVDDLKLFEVSLPFYIRSISSRLSRRSYTFSPATGVLKDKSKRERQGKQPRPIIVSLVQERVVQRAILDALCPEEGDAHFAHVGRLSEIVASPYSFGGTRHGGVPREIKQITSSIRDGYVYFFKSDISGFFTHIPHADVLTTILRETGDEEITAIFQKALSVELANKDKLGKYFDLFPHGGIGVPQGSSLSTFAGNVLLFDFDKLLNDNATIMLRYIDDVIILGRTNEAVQKAKSKALTYLKRFRMNLYKVDGDRRKADEGHVRNGIYHLGCWIYDGRVQPDREARQRLMHKLAATRDEALLLLDRLLRDECARAHVERSYIQSLAKIDRQIHGWGTHYKFIDSRLCLHQIDDEIDDFVAEYEQNFFARLHGCGKVKKRRIMGITLLQDIIEKSTAQAKQS